MLQIAPTAMIHPSSYYDDGVTIGERTNIWHFCHVMSGAVIGDDCNIGQNVFVDRNVRIGNKTKIQNNVSVYRGVTLEDEVFIGPSVVFTNDKTPRAAFPKQPFDYPSTYVRRGASIGANATIVCGIVIDEYAFVAAGSVVTKDVPKHVIVLGNPARAVGSICRCGKTILRPVVSAFLCECMP